MIHGKDDKVVWCVSKNELSSGVSFFKMHWDNKRKIMLYKIFFDFTITIGAGL